jgi:hypothetical protein
VAGDGDQSWNRARFQFPASSQRVNKIIEITKKIEKSADDQLAALFLSYIRYTPPPADPFSDVESYPAMKFLLPVNSQTGFIAWFGHSVANSHFAPKATRMRGGLDSAGGSVAEKGLLMEVSSNFLRHSGVCCSPLRLYLTLRKIPPPYP